MTVIRPRKDGGYSECNSPDELVGKGRCCHILGGDGIMEKPMTLKKLQRGMYEVEVEENKMTISAQKETIKKFFENIPKIDEEKQRKIIEFLDE